MYMKKKYFVPQLDVVTIATRGIICTSGLSLGDDTDVVGITEAESPEFDFDLTDDDDLDLFGE